MNSNVKGIGGFGLYRILILDQMELEVFLEY